MKLINRVFDKKWIEERPGLKYALLVNQPYIDEVEKWLEFFNSKGWLNEKLIKRLKMARSWNSFYSKINELRAGYFFENKLSIELLAYESPSIKNKNVEFKGKIRDKYVFIEVKSPLDLKLNKWKFKWYNHEDELLRIFNKAILQLPNNNQSILVISDNLNPNILFDIYGSHISIWKLLEISDFQKISAVCILGDISINNIYEMVWACNPNATIEIKEEIFSGYRKINNFL